MNDNLRPCDHRHALPKLTALLLPLLALVFPLLALVGCSSGISGHAPGLAGPQSQDPGTFTYPLAYIKRPPPTADIDVRDLITSTAGGDLYIRDQASAGGVEVNLTKSITTGLGDVRDLDVSPDGKKLLFSLRLPLIKGAKEINQPTWKIYQYDAVLKTVTQLTNDATTRGHDVGAHYLPDGRIVFASTRQAATQAILIDEGRPQYPAQTDDRKQDIFLLHVMNADGSNIQQISFNTNHDFAPSVLSNGQIVFSRYESINGDQISLYRVNPDGSGLELFYGANSHATGANNAGTNTSVIQFLSARQRADGKLLALVRPLQYTQAGLDTQEGGDIVAIDAGNFVEIRQQAVPSATGTPATGGTGQVSATTLGVTTDPDKPSLGGRFGSVYPLFDGTNRMLVSWAPCLVLASATSSTTSVCNNDNTTGATVTLAPPEYTIWVYDFAAGTLSPILSAESGLMIVEPVILQARVPAPTAALATPPTTESTTLAGLGQGILDIRSVYDFDGVDTVKTQTGNAVPSIAALADPKQATADQRPARFIRVEKAVEIPSKDVRKINNSAFGPAGMGMREILAYAPIEPDGSVKIQLPANVPFTIEILDKNARRISAQQHASWLQLVPGETKVCKGCHNPANAANPLFPLSHGRTGLTNSVYAGAAGPGVAFPNTVTTFTPANKGDTMAETRVATTCQTGSTMPCSQVPSIDVLYTDVWTDAAIAGRPADAPFSYLYSDLSTPKPSNTHCVTWDALCRSTIHYPDDTMPPYHIQSLWDFPRLVMVGGVAVDHTCVTCHTPIGAAAAIQIPAGQLDLRAVASTDDTSVSTSYRQLLFPRNEQALIMGAPVPTGVVLPPPMTAGSSVNSSASFLRLFDGTYHDPQVDHTGFLTPAELRLITEWIDIGAQYYNDPFVAPVAN
jgi:Hydrazine synthase alpha subunit middle domain